MWLQVGFWLRPSSVEIYFRTHRFVRNVLDVSRSFSELVYFTCIFARYSYRKCAMAFLHPPACFSTGINVFFVKQCSEFGFICEVEKKADAAISIWSFNSSFSSHQFILSKAAKKNSFLSTICWYSMNIMCLLLLLSLRQGVHKCVHWNTSLNRLLRQRKFCK